jgi:hypothetical protein
MLPRPRFNRRIPNTTRNRRTRVFPDRAARRQHKAGPEHDSMQEENLA